MGMTMTEKILARARRQGIISAEAVPDDEAIFKLIFEPGFSTAEKVTDMSGRGVGMDVVRKQIQKLRGRIAIRSTLGKGCTFTLRLPLTLAIIDGLVVGAGLIGPNRRTSRVKEMPYESGMDPVHDTRRRFDVRFHLVAITFLVFDVELIAFK